MPYRLRKAPKRDLYWVVAQDGTKKSKDPIPKERAEAQIRALYASENQNGTRRVKSSKRGMGITYSSTAKVVPAESAEEAVTRQIRRDEVSRLLKAVDTQLAMDAREGKSKAYLNWITSLRQAPEKGLLARLQEVVERNREIEYDSFPKEVQEHIGTKHNWVFRAPYPPIPANISMASLDVTYSKDKPAIYKDIRDTPLHDRRTYNSTAFSAKRGQGKKKAYCIC